MHALEANPGRLSSESVGSTGTQKTAIWTEGDTEGGTEREPGQSTFQPASTSPNNYSVKSSVS